MATIYVGKEGVLRYNVACNGQCLREGGSGCPECKEDMLTRVQGA